MKDLKVLSFLAYKSKCTLRKYFQQAYAQTASFSERLERKQATSAGRTAFSEREKLVLNETLKASDIFQFAWGTRCLIKLRIFLTGIQILA